MKTVPTLSEMKIEIAQRVFALEDPIALANLLETLKGWELAGEPVHLSHPTPTVQSIVESESAKGIALEQYHEQLDDV